MEKCAEDVTGLSMQPNVRGPDLVSGLVEEHSMCSEAASVRSRGAHGRENVGLSNHKAGERPARRKPKVSLAMNIIQGLAGSNP